jgi:hypothetical protein
LPAVDPRSNRNASHGACNASARFLAHITETAKHHAESRWYQALWNLD